MKSNPQPRYWYEYITEEVAARARTDEALQYLIVAVVNAAADFDMFASGKVDAAGQDHESSYWYFRDIVNRLGIPPQVIVDVIDECCPDHPGKNLTEAAPPESGPQPFV